MSFGVSFVVSEVKWWVVAFEPSHERDSVIAITTIEGNGGEV